MRCSQETGKCDNLEVSLNQKGADNGDSGPKRPPIPVQIRPGIPIILCKGFSDENDEQHAKAMGVKGFLMKPVATGDLAEMVRKVLDEFTETVSRVTRLVFEEGGS